MTQKLNRRRLIGLSAGAVLAGSAAAEEKESGFAFPLLGDLHFDRLEHHDMEWLAREKPEDVRQVTEYSRLTEQVLPRLFPEVRDQIAASKPRVPFALHVGDLVEGLCGTPELARRHCIDAVAFVREAKLGKPFLFTKGNHDITGPGAPEAFNEILLPWQAKQARQELKSASFTVEEGGALFVFFDGYSRDSLAWLERTLEGRRPGRLFVIVHQPVVPYGARSLWHIYAHPNQAPQRQRLLDLLGRHRAIVLCGHLHKYGVVVRKTGEGAFAQLAVSSIIRKPAGEPEQVLAGLKEYGPDLVRLEPNFSPANVEERRAALAAEAPFIRHYEYADAPGYAVLRVRDASVEADIYSGLGKRRWKTLDLTALLGG